MMGRLIDADKLKTDLEKAISKNEDMDCLDFLRAASVIDAQPTAYDPDKVVEQLEEKTELAFQRYMDCPKNSPCYQRYQEQYLQRKMCLDIVKAGGINDNTD